jgi:protein tyrosine/serine phosphatase
MGWLANRVKSLKGRPGVYGVVAVALLAALGWGVKVLRHHFLPHHFYVVESGGIYRGARQSPNVLRKIIREYHIRTIVNLDDKVLEKENPGRPGADLYADEKAIAKESGLQYYGFVWQGSGIGPYPEYDVVADILATTSSRPVFLHCAAGEKRTNAALAAYWIRRRGYTLEQAVEGLKHYGFVPRRKPDFMEHLRGYDEYVKRHPRPTDSPSAPPKKP